MANEMMISFEELADRWDSIKVQPKSREELKTMTRSWNVPRLRRMQQGMIVECLVSIGLVTVVLWLLDLTAGPRWLAVAFAGCIVFYLFNSFLGYKYLSIVPPGSIRSSLILFKRRMKTMLSLTSIANIGMSTVTLLIMNIRGGSENLVVWSFLLVVLIVVTWMSYRKWEWRIRETEMLLTELNKMDFYAG